MKGMCARLLMCPLCSQPGFLTLDALRAGLISVATRPLICPVCNEVLLGIDKLTIHLFSHTINLNGNNLNNSTVETSKQLNITTSNSTLVSIQSIQDACFQDWNTSKQHSTGVSKAPSINDLNTQASLESGTKSIATKDKPVSSSAMPAQNQNLALKAIPQIVFVANQSCESERTNAFHEHCEKNRVPSEMLKVNNAVQHYSNENNKHMSAPENHGRSEEHSIQTIKEWIQEQQCEQRTLTRNAAHMNPNKPNRSAREPNQTEPVKFGGNAQNFDNKYSNFESFSKIIETDLESHENEKNKKRNMIDEGSRNEDGKYEQVSLNLKRSKDPTEKTERCDICGFHFPDYNILLLHKQLVHMIEEKDLNVIPENYFKNYSCHLCSKVFKMRGSLMVHMRVAHIGHSSGSSHKDGQVEVIFNENGYNCPTCGKKFKKEQHVTQHLKTHEAKQWECDVCSKMFTTKYFLKKHKRLHSGEMPYKCSICNKTFTFQQSYHKHRLYHKDDKPHTCATCGRSFKELSTLHNHERIHTGEKPFACETCGKCFRQRVSYLVHRRIHTGVMPYKCALCGKSFRYKVSQRTHKCPAQQSVQQASDSEQKQVQLPETQTANSDHCEAQERNSSQDHQPILHMVANEENKYILIINNQGQHILTREADARNMQESGNKPQSSENVNINGENKELKNQWVTNVPNSLIFRKPIETSNKVETVNEKQTAEDTNDFFSMVMVPLENEISSPTSQMEHLRVSSPTRKEDILESYSSFKINSDSVQMNLPGANLNGNFTNDHNANSLETINEESLKQLLYGINDK